METGLAADIVCGAVEPAEAINVVESVLRVAVRDVLGDSWAQGSKLDLTKLGKLRDEEAMRRNGAVVQQELLAYTHLYQLHPLVTKNWEKFKPVFKDQARFKIYMKRLEDFRNAPMHSRSLLPFERDLLSGIAGELRNSLTLWRSAQAPDMSWYPTVESITDSLGNSLIVDAGIVRVAALLQVGDVVTFRCVGWDPQDRELTWTLHAQGHIGPEINREIGSEVTLAWTVGEEHVAETSIIAIKMRSDGKYHRDKTGSDSIVHAFYSVDPPAGSG